MTPLGRAPDFAGARASAEPSRAVVVGATGGIGAALAARLAAGGTRVHAFGRTLPPTGPGIVAAMLDVTDEASIAAAAASLGDGAPIRLVIVATGHLHDAAGGPEKSLAALDPARLARSFAVNAIGPALVAKHILPLMPRQGRCAFAALSARVGSIGDNRLGGWYGYRASKAALNQMLRTIAIEARRSRPDLIVAALHPGTVATPLSAPFRGDPVQTFTPSESAGHILAVLERLTPADSGGFFAWDGKPIPF